MADHATCFCSSDVKCPHGISTKVPNTLDELEIIIDSVLKQFDRKTIKKYLKHNSFLENSSVSSNNNKESVNLSSLSNVNNSKNRGQLSEKLKKAYGQDLQSLIQNNNALDKKANDEIKKKLNNEAINPLKLARPMTSDQPTKRLHVDNKRKANDDFDTNNNNNSNPRYNDGNKISRNQLMSKTLPALNHNPNFEEKNVSMPIFNINEDNSVDEHKKADLAVHLRASKLELPGSDSDGLEMPGDTGLSVGLMKIADVLSRKVLPWQAIVCPRAIETLRDIRVTLIQSRHVDFLAKMKKQVEDKVVSFIDKKNDEVNEWVEKEQLLWQQTLYTQESNQNEFIESNNSRITKRSLQQNAARQRRELGVASNSDGREREDTRLQLVKFRRLCRAENKNNTDIRALNENIEMAFNQANNVSDVSSRELFKRSEECHEWLCCLADNAITASDSESTVKSLFTLLDKERDRGMASLNNAINKYKEQHEAILEAITIFHGKIHQHASDYLQREQLISRGFLQYLLTIVSGEVNAHTNDQKRSSMAWEGKFAADRAFKREQSFNRDYNLTLQAFDKLIGQLKERMHYQYEHVIVTLQSVFNGRDAFLNQRKERIHKKLAKYVNKVCNNRRLQLKNLNTTRSDEYDLEKRCVTSLNKLTVTVRQQVDQIWIKQLLRERRMYEASNGRMDRLEKSALIIWNRHSHLAISQKEEYDDWLSMYSKDRDIVTEERMELISREWGEWRTMFSLKIRKSIDSLTAPISKFAIDECNYDLSVSMEANLETLASDSKFLKNSISNVLQVLRNAVDDFHTKEITQITSSTDLRIEMLMNEWQDNLKRLNSTINKRIGALKDMESDLEETIRLTLVQHESEASVFEQQSSSAVEEFWLDSRTQLENIGKDILQASKEYEAYVDANKLKVKGSVDTGSNESTNKNITDSSRARKVLDEIKIEVYREFNTKVLRALEKVKLDYGQGRKRCIPPFLATRVLFQAMDWFWDAAKLSERCIGRVASRGLLLFREGVPPSARSFFIVASAMMVLSQINLNEDDLLDCEDILAILDGKGSKRVFLIGLLFLTQKLESFGDRLLLLECIWGCSCFGVSPPDDIIQQYENSSKYGGAGCIAGGGFAHADPGDLINSVLVDASDDEIVEGTIHSDISSVRSEHKMREELINVSQESFVHEISSKVAPLLPKSDWAVLLGVLGRNDGVIEITGSRVAQAVMLWRKVALVIIGAVIEPPGSDYPQYSFLLQQHLACHRIQKREGYAHIASISPFEAMTLTIDWITNFAGVPISFLQSLGLIGRGGSCDPWLEDPYLSCRSGRFLYELKELLDSFYCRDTLEVIQKFLVSFTPNLRECLRPFDINTSNTVPLELLRSFLHREDSVLTCAQISSVFWCLSRKSNDSWFNLHEHTAQDSLQESTPFSGPVFTPISCPPIDTVFTGSVDEYMASFSKDVGRFLDTMPSLDTNCIVGLPPYALTPAAANEVLLSAMKLDPSARNPIPSSCSLWLGAKVMNVDEAISVVSNPNDKSSSTGGLMITVGMNSSDINDKEKTCTNLRMKIETDFLTIYPLHCTKRAADEDFHASDNPLSDADFLKELMHRRLDRVDKLTLCWRDIMVNEWATSLYQSRQKRYEQRAVVVRNCINCYHKQYKKLKESIVQERSSLISKYRAFETELSVAGSNEKSFITFHTSFIDRLLRQAEEYLSASIGILTNVLGQFQRHCGSIRRIGLARIDQAEARVRASMGESCSGLILGYTAGYAQGHFDAMMYRGEILRKSVSNMHAQIIDEKETFLSVKDDLERDIMCEVADRISVDRNRVKTFMDILTADTAEMQELLAKTRASYVTLQKDANTRLVMRIENAIRESRKLRSAAEKDAELEQVVLAEITTILDNTKSTCKSIIEQIKSTCLDQLKSIYPLRTPHRDKMTARISTVHDNWNELKNVLIPLIDNFEAQSNERLQIMKSKAINFIGEYREMECAAILADYKIEREALTSSFRDHFSRFQLGEAGIFERFNKEIADAIAEIKSNWGPSRPQFLRKAVSDTYAIAEEAMRGYSLDITKDLIELRSHGDGVGRWIIDEDNIVFKRYEVADILCHSLLDVYDTTATLPNRYIQEKETILKEVHSKAMDIDGDIVGPQVHAIMDLLLAGIEIASDFERGYMDLITATEVKCNDAIIEISDFVTKLSSSTVSSSIPATKNVICDRVTRRTEEITSLLAAADAHLVADHTHFEVLLQTSEKDIEEWVMLTTQLVDNAFLNAGGNYLDPVWPTPSSTPRLEILPEEDDRIAKLRALLKLNQETPEEMYTYKGKDLRSNRDEEFLKSKKSFLPASTAAITLLDSPREHEKFYPKPESTLGTSPIKISESFTELQNGWLECNDNGKVYYFNPETDQSLWDLPFEMKVKKTSNISAKASGKGVSKQVNVNNVVVKDVLDEARSIANTTSEIATEITSLIKSKDHFAIRSDNIINSPTNQAPSRPSHDNARSLRQASIKSIGSVEEDNFSLHSSNLKQKGIYKIRVFGNDPLGILLHEDSVSIEDHEVTIIKVGGIDVLTLDGSQTSSSSILKFVRMDDILVSVNGNTMINQTMEYAGSILAPLKAAMETREFVFLNPSILSFEQYLRTPKELLEKDLDNDDDDDDDEDDNISFDRNNIIVNKEAVNLDTESDNLGHQLTSAGLNISMIDPKKIIEELNKSEVDPHEWLKTKKATIKRVYADDDSDYEGGDEVKKFKAEEKYRETRETDFLVREDILSKKVESLIDAELGRIFSEKLQIVASVNHVTREEIRKLKLESYSLKKATVSNKLKENMITWEDLDIKVLDTEVAEREAQKLADSLKTEAGRERQRKVLEKQEDIEIMFEFFREIGIGKSTSRNAATEAILLKLDTSKKLAKVWKRGDIKLGSLGLDEDEIEDVEAKLNLVLAQGVKEKQAFSRSNSRPNTTFSGKSTPINDTNTFSNIAMTEGLGLGLDPLVDNSIYELVEDPSTYSTEYQSNNQSNYDLSSYRNDASQNLHQYKSYRGDWTEGYSPEGHLYYYNTFTGESSWTLPAGIERTPSGGLSRRNTGLSRKESGLLTYQEQDEWANEDQSLADYNWTQSNHDNSQYNYNDASGGDVYNNPSINNNQNTNNEVIKPEESPPVKPQSPVAPVPAPKAITPTNNKKRKDSYFSFLGKKEEEVLLPKPRSLPIPVLPEVTGYSKGEGIARQARLIEAQERWHKGSELLNKIIAREQESYFSKKKDMFEKVSTNIESKLGILVDDVKFMQRTLKKELAVMNANEADLRRLLEEDSVNVIMAEKLSYILDGLEKLKINLATNYESSFRQMDKFVYDWNFLRTELLQTGVVFDDVTVSNLAKVRTNTEHQIKVFAFHQINNTTVFKKNELRILRIHLRKVLLSDTMAAQESRSKVRKRQLKAFHDREVRKNELIIEYKGREGMIEPILTKENLTKLEIDKEMRPEEEIVMSFMLSQIEMEVALSDDYDAIIEATKSVTQNLQKASKDYDAEQKQNSLLEGSWFNKHRDTISRHDSALTLTLQKVRTKVRDGYTILNSKVEALDFDVEHAAEAEIEGRGQSDNFLEP